MKQYIPLKPVKRGSKVWAMVDARNGYVYDFNVYTGVAVTGDRETGLGEVVLTWAEFIKGTTSCTLTTTSPQSFDEVTI